MYYEIIPNRFAPKKSDEGSGALPRSHSICYGKCNFKCAFCDFPKRPVSQYVSYDTEAFTELAKELMTKGKSFKFTGGEPTLNPMLEEHLRIVRELGGYIYLDSNGSNPERISSLADKGLIDVLGISLKGITPQEAAQVAGVSSHRIVWDNVWQTLKTASAYADSMRTIVTLVFTEENRAGRLERFAELLAPLGNVYMKINNLQRDDHPEEIRMHSVDSDSLYREISDFVEAHPTWKGRTIYIPTENAVSEYSSIVFF